MLILASDLFAAFVLPSVWAGAAQGRRLMAQAASYRQVRRGRESSLIRMFLINLSLFMANRLTGFGRSLYLTLLAGTCLHCTRTVTFR
jgi:hypothetical protein